MSSQEFSELKQLIKQNEYWGDRLASDLHQRLNNTMSESEQLFQKYDAIANKVGMELLKLYQQIDQGKALGEVKISDFYRSGQLQNILDTIRTECQALGVYENAFINKLLQSAVNDGYRLAGNTFDITLGGLNKKAIEATVLHPWTDKLFSDRIWDNKSKLIDQLNDKLTTGLATGRSPYAIANDLQKRMDGRKTNSSNESIRTNTR